MSSIRFQNQLHITFITVEKKQGPYSYSVIHSDFPCPIPLAPDINTDTERKYCLRRWPHILPMTFVRCTKVEENTQPVKYPSGYLHLWVLVTTNARVWFGRRISGRRMWTYLVRARAAMNRLSEKQSCSGIIYVLC